MPTIKELRQFIRENKGPSCAPYSKLKKDQLLERAVAAGYVVVDKPPAAKKRQKRKVPGAAVVEEIPPAPVVEEKKKKPEVKKPEVSEIRTVKKTKKMTPKTNPNYEERKGIKEQIVELSREYNEKYGREAINKQYLTKENKAEFTKAMFALANQILSLIKEGGVEGWANFDDDAS